MLVITESRSTVYFFQLAFWKLKRRWKGIVCGLMAVLTSNVIGRCGCEEWGLGRVSMSMKRCCG